MTRMDSGLDQSRLGAPNPRIMPIATPYFTCGIPHAPLLLRLNMPAAHLHTGLDPIYLKIDYIRLFKPKGAKAGYADLTPVYH